MKKRNTKQVILPLITSFIWGSSFVAQSLGAGKVGGFTFTAARAIPAVLVLGALVLILRRVRHEEKYTPQQKKDLLEGGLVCGIFLTLGTNLQQFGIADTTAGKAGFITALYIVLVPLAGMFLGKKANKRLFLCVLIAVVGLYFLCFTGSEGAMSFGRGDFLVFLCAFAFTGHILCVDHYVQKVDGIALSCVQFAMCRVWSCLPASPQPAGMYGGTKYKAIYPFEAMTAKKRGAVNRLSLLRDIAALPVPKGAFGTIAPCVPHPRCGTSRPPARTTRRRSGARGIPLCALRPIAAP